MLDRSSSRGKCCSVGHFAKVLFCQRFKNLVCPGKFVDKRKDGSDADSSHNVARVRLYLVVLDDQGFHKDSVAELLLADQK